MDSPVGTPRPEVGPSPSVDLIRRDWESGPHAELIRAWSARIPHLAPARRTLLLVGVALETGHLPLIEPYGLAEFRPVTTDHRLLLPAEDHHETTHTTATSDPASRPSAPRPSAVGSRTATWGADPGAQGAETGASARQQLIRGYRSVGDVITEDAAPLALYFPQFSPVLWDPDLRLWFREGWLQPLRSWPCRFGVRLYYEVDPYTLPLVCVRPELPSNTPHLWLQTRSGIQFRSLCYTFAPDRTIVRGRGEDDDAAEVLRQAVVWLLRYLVWKEFGFWPGADVGHDPATLERLTRPSDPCPVHSARRYGECCRPRVLAELSRRRELRCGIQSSARVA